MSKKSKRKGRVKALPGPNHHKMIISPEVAKDGAYVEAA